MGKTRITFRLLFLLFSIIRFASAQTPPASAPTPLPKGWLKAALLRPGEPLSVRVRFASDPTLCTLSWIDNNALACSVETWSSASERLIFPVSQVESVERDRTGNCYEACGEGKRLLVGAGIGGLVGGLVLAGNSAQAGAFGAMLGAGAGGSFAVAPQGFGMPSSPAMSLRVPLRGRGNFRRP